MVAEQFRGKQCILYLIRLEFITEYPKKLIKSKYHSLYVQIKFEMHGIQNLKPLQTQPNNSFIFILAIMNHFVEP